MADRSLLEFLRLLAISPDRIVFVPYPQVSGKTWNPLALLQARQHVRREYAKHFGNVCGADVFYWTNYFDWMSFAFLKRLAAANSVYSCQLDKSEFVPVANCGVKDWLALQAIRFITGVDLFLVSLDRAEFLIPAFPSSRYSVAEVEVGIDSEAIARHLQDVEGRGSCNVLLLETATTRSGPGYEDSMRRVVEALIQGGISVYVKGHPRMGSSQFLRAYNVSFLEQCVPVEMMRFKGFSAIVGLSSSGLGTLAAANPDILVVSVLQLFPGVSRKVRDGVRNQLVRICPSIMFVLSMEELIESVRGRGGGGGNRGTYRRERGENPLS
ncbi:hypothetical protein ACFLQU_03245 [Verrucomicrobiota bacterium]